MRLEDSDLDLAVARGLIGPEQAHGLRALAAERSAQRLEERPGLTLQHLAYYLGGLVVVGAMGWLLTNAWLELGGWGLSGVAVAYAGAFLLAAARLRRLPGCRIPAGLLTVLAVCMTPLAVYGLELALDIWPQAPAGTYAEFWGRAKGCWLAMELATILAGLAALRRWPFPFLTAPIAVALWFLSMDLGQFFFLGGPFAWEERRLVSLWFGLAMLAGAISLEGRGREDFAFWGELFGLLAFWGALTAAPESTELARLGYCAVNVALLLAGVLLQRRGFLVFGAFGVSLYLGHLAHRVFRDSLAFPLALTALGLGIMGAGLAYQRKAARLEAAMQNLLPEGARAWLARLRDRA